MNRRNHGRLAGCLALGALLAVTRPPGAAAAETTSDVQPLFVISKSENHNRVAYGVHVDSRCVPQGPAAVFAFWQMLELGPGRVEPLLSRELPYYGVRREQSVGDRSVEVRLAAIPSRPVLVHTSLEGGRCRATATLPIGGTPARLWNVHAVLSWPFGVKALLLTGLRETDGAVVRETVSP
jgi:hypothetical protein